MTKAASSGGPVSKRAPSLMETYWVWGLHIALSGLPVGHASQGNTVLILALLLNEAKAAHSCNLIQ